MWVMYDSTTVGEIPASANAVAGYDDGKYVTFPQLEKRWPHAHRLAIAVFPTDHGECLDIENGDATPADAPGWYHRQRPRVERPVFYCNLDTARLVVSALGDAGIDRGRYRLWTAHYTDIPHICGPAEGLVPAADATQWTNHALGRNLDETLCASTFFQASNLMPADEARWEHEYDQLLHKPGPWAALRRRVLRRVMTQRRKQIWQLAEHEPEGWEHLNRRHRYHQLQLRTE